MSDGFEIWLRTECFQKPTLEAYDLAKDAWNAGRRHGHGDTVMVKPITLDQAKQVIKAAGMVVVPVEPTDAMTDAANALEWWEDHSSEIFEAMIKAAQDKPGA